MQKIVWKRIFVNCACYHARDFFLLLLLNVNIVAVANFLLPTVLALAVRKHRSLCLKHYIWTQIME